MSESSLIIQDKVLNYYGALIELAIQLPPELPRCNFSYIKAMADSEPLMQVCCFLEDCGTPKALRFAHKLQDLIANPRKVLTVMKYHYLEAMADATALVLRAIALTQTQIKLTEMARNELQCWQRMEKDATQLLWTEQDKVRFKKKTALLAMALNDLNGTSDEVSNLSVKLDRVINTGLEFFCPEQQTGMDSATLQEWKLSKLNHLEEKLIDIAMERYIVTPPLCWTTAVEDLAMADLWAQYNRLKQKFETLAQVDCLYLSRFFAGLE